MVFANEDMLVSVMVVTIEEITNKEDLGGFTVYIYIQGAKCELSAVIVCSVCPSHIIQHHAVMKHNGT